MGADDIFFESKSGLSRSDDNQMKISDFKYYDSYISGLINSSLHFLGHEAIVRDESYIYENQTKYVIRKQVVIRNASRFIRVSFQDTGSELKQLRLDLVDTDDKILTMILIEMTENSLVKAFLDFAKFFG